MEKFLQFGSNLAPGDGIIERLVILLDVSGSMGSSDYFPTRLMAAANASYQLILVRIDKHPQDEIAIVTFGSNAKVVHNPIVVAEGHGSLKTALDNLSVRGSTNMVAGIRASEKILRNCREPQAAKSLTTRISNWLYSDENSPSQTWSTYAKRIVILTDGNSDSSPLKAARSAKSQGATIDVIGIGGSPAKVNEKALRKVASTNADGSPRYCFIDDHIELKKQFKKLGGHLRATQ